MRQPNLRILVVDDHALMREAVAALLADAEGVEVVGEAATAPAALRLTDELGPDVVLLDLRLPGATGFTCLDALRRNHPEVAVVVFSGVDDPELVAAALARGAAGYVLKRISPLDLPTAIRQTIERSVFHGSRTTPEPVASGLSQKELEVLQELALGRSNREIADALFIGEATVKTHLIRAFAKLGVTDRTAAVTAAYGAGLIDLPRT